MKELIQLLQIWKDQGAIKPDGLLKDNDIQMLIDKMVAESQKSAIPIVSEWVAVDEALPNHGEEVLTVTEDNWYRITQFGSIGKGKFPSQVTHWMRLPEPPCR